MTSFYGSLLSDVQDHPHLVAEVDTPYKCFSEQHVQVMWFEQKYFNQISTDQGNPIEVISPGIWNAEAGPDFLKAHLKIGQTEYRGDIEIHLQSDGWYQHKHHCDPRYDQVILHLAFWKTEKRLPVVTNNGKDVLEVFVEPFLTNDIDFISRMIDLELYPYKEFIGSGRCAHDLFKIATDEEIEMFFQSASGWRLIQKKKYLKSYYEVLDLQFALGLARALGYKQNPQEFTEIFHWLHRLNSNDEDLLLAYAMKACGFFTSLYQDKWQGSSKYAELMNIADKSPDAPQIKLKLHNIRPLNHPVRRLLILAKILSKKIYKSLYHLIMRLWNERWMTLEDQKSCRKLYAELHQLIPSFEDPYWNSHYSFELQPREEIIPLIGHDFKDTLIINVVFPLLYSQALVNGNKLEEAAFQKFFASASSRGNSKTRYLTHRLFGDSPRGSVMNSAFAEQGAFQLHQDFCTKYEASCEGCPFVENYERSIKYHRERQNEWSDYSSYSCRTGN